MRLRPKPVLKLRNLRQISLERAFEDAGQCQEFRSELVVLQKTLRGYSGALSEMAGVENLPSLEG